jgi:hypothetical protein
MDRYRYAPSGHQCRKRDVLGGETRFRKDGDTHTYTLEWNYSGGRGRVKFTINTFNFDTRSGLYHCAFILTAAVQYRESMRYAKDRPHPHFNTSIHPDDRRLTKDVLEYILLIQWRYRSLDEHERESIGLADHLIHSLHLDQEKTSSTGSNWIGIRHLYM